MNHKSINQLQWLKKNYTLIVVLLIISSLFSTMSFYLDARVKERQLIAQKFDHDTDEAIRKLETSFQSYIATMYAIRSFYHSSDIVSEAEFQSFVEYSIVTQPGIMSLEWVPIVTIDERRQIEKAFQEDGQEAFLFQQYSDEGWIASDEEWSDLYYPVLFKAPPIPNDIVIGIDLGSAPDRMEAISLAQSTGALTTSAPITLLTNEGYSDTGFLLFLAVYDEITAVSSAEWQHDVQGFILGVFRINDIVNTSLIELERNNIAMRITDMNSLNGILVDQVTDLDLKDTLVEERSLMMGDRQWYITLVATPSYIESNQSGKPIIYLFAGLLFTMLLIVLIRVMGARLTTLEQIVQQSEKLRTVNKKLRLTTADLSRSKLRLEQNNRELKQFAYIASHDLQEPLRAVTSYVQLLAYRYKGKLDEEADEFIDFAVNGTLRMKALINDLMAYTHIDNMNKESTYIDVHIAIEVACQNLSFAIEESKATILYNDLPTLFVNETHLIQLIQNLISNAIKFRKAELSPIIEISCERVGNMWRFACRDEGIGIETAYRKKIFKIFQRLHYREEYPGTGVGLAICQKIVEQYGGEIWVESIHGEGTTFYFTFPIALNRPTLSEATFSKS